MRVVADYGGAAINRDVAHSDLLAANLIAAYAVVVGGNVIAHVVASRFAGMPDIIARLSALGQPYWDLDREKPKGGVPTCGSKAAKWIVKAFSFFAVFRGVSRPSRSKSMLYYGRANVRI